MVHVYPNDLMRAVAMAANDQRVPEGSVQALRDELTNDPASKGYAAYLESEAYGPVVDLLARPYAIDNPEPQGMAVRSSIDPKALRAYLNKIELADAEGKTPGYKIRQRALVADETGLVCDSLLEAFNYDNIATDDLEFQYGLSVILDAGYITQDQVNSFLLVPDPTYQPVLNMPSRLQSIGLGEGCVVSVRDIVEVMTSGE